MLNACFFVSASKGGGLKRNDLCPSFFIMLVLHPSSSCDICYDIYRQENPASTIPCGHIFCYRYVRRLARPCRNTTRFCSSGFACILVSADVFPCANRACARCVGGSFRAPTSRNSERRTMLNMWDPKRFLATQFPPHRARRPAYLNDNTL